ncbi:hypothetical protein JW921_05690, partial [Candidatus Fermentibacterales bacterium]|nr:hypothetical protein [Candidatus Fermentibacterales bacterium]
YPWEARGWWSTDTEAWLLFYDPGDLERVAAGDLEPWQPQPYATMCLDRFLCREDDPAERMHRLGPCCCDSERGILYVLENRAWEDRPVVHVWAVKS